MLARREHGYNELCHKLLNKKFNEADVQAVLTALVDEGLLNEQRFVENFIHYRRQKGIGPLRVRAELMERGVAEDLIEHHLQITDNAWFDAVQRTWQKRFKNRLPEDSKARAQQMRFLYYRGFTHVQIDKLFRGED